MAQTNVLTDGAVTVDLATLTSGFAMVSGGYNQQIVEKDELGRYPRVTEEWAVNWAAVDDDARGVIHENLMILKAKARRWANGDQVDGAVWREVDTGTEAGSRFALVFDVLVPQLSPDHYEAGAANKLSSIRMIREGVWRNASPPGFTAVEVGTVYDYWVGSNRNYRTILSDEVGGDADGIIQTICTISTYDYQKTQEILMAKRTAETEAELDNYQPHFNANNLISLPGGAYVADANVPGGQRVDLTNGLGVDAFYLFTWQIPTTVDAYRGNHLMFVDMRINVSSSGLTLNSFHGDSNVPTFGELQDYTHLTALGTPLLRLDAGVVSLPRSGRIPYGADLTGDYYEIGFGLTLKPSTSVSIHRMYLCPTDEGLFMARNIGDSSLPASYYPTVVYIDGHLERVYGETATGKLATKLQIEPNGRFLTASHNRVTRLYFYRSFNGLQGTSVYYGLSSFTANVQVVRRYKALRYTE